VDDDAPAVDIASNDDDESEEEVDPDDPEDHAGHDHDDEDAPDVTSDVFDDDAPPSPSTVTVGNDPMMKLHGGKFVKFSLSPGILSPLLSWTSHRQDEILRMELFGKTFSSAAMDADNNAVAPPQGTTQTRMLGGGPKGLGRCQSGLNRTLNAVEQLATSGGSTACCPASRRRHARRRGRQGGAAPAGQQGGQNKRRRRGQARQARRQRGGGQGRLHGAGARGRLDDHRARIRGQRRRAGGPIGGRRQRRRAVVWQLTLTANGVKVLDVTRGQGRFGQMRVVVEGHEAVHGGPGHEGELVSDKYGLKATLRQGQNHLGKDYRGQKLSVDAPGFKFAIESMPAKKYTDLASQIKYAHLNLKFDEANFPSFSDGFLAQLAGVRTMDRASKLEYSVGRAHSASGVGNGGGFNP